MKQIGNSAQISRNGRDFIYNCLYFFTEKKDEQKGLPKSTVYGIIAGAICFLALIIVIAAIVCAKKRRSRSQGMFTSGIS